jgi:hypothetical protein
MNERDKLIEKLIREKGGSRKDYLNLIRRIEHHETGGTYDTQIEAGRLKGHAKKSGAVGILQYKKGKNEGGIVAARRLARYYKKNNMPIEPWLKEALKGNSLDVRKLNREQQETLFLGDMREHPKADFSKVWKGEQSIKDFWLDNHWAGDKKYRNKRAESFDNSMKDYENFIAKQAKQEQPSQIQTPPPVTAELQGAPQDNMQFIVDRANKLAEGGMLPNSAFVGESNYFGTGGLHEDNPYGGIPQGMGANGKMNTVEEGEVSFNFEDGKYIFSNRIGAHSTANQFAGGGKPNTTDPPVKEKKVFGPQPEDKPLEFTKTSPVFIPGGGLKHNSETFQVPDVREQYMTPNFVSTEKTDTPNFDLAVTNPGAKSFLDRYNDPWTRQKMAEQTGLSQEDIDNMILKGLSPEKIVGGNKGGSNAMYDRDENKIRFSADQVDTPGLETHERVHASMFDAAQGQNLLDVLGSPYEQEKIAKFRKYNDFELPRYMNMPHEAYGNFAEFREKLGLKPGEQLTEEELIKRVNKKNLGLQNFYRVFDRKKILKALNTIASTNKTTNNNTRLA